jgi:Inheritance of peroxisomes protein 1
MATPPLPRQRPAIQAGGIRRSFTQPPRLLSFHERAGLDPSDSAADILYSHPRARIVSFNPPTDAARSVSSPVNVDLDYPVDTIETLPWASSAEEVLATGSLIIEKIRGSTNFLKSGTKPLHALMRNSQCWCVDGEATLVMRVGAFKYYRIELPYKTEEDKAKVQQLKDVLKRILRFEATPCPFKRGFHVDLPESATTPRKKGPWKRKPGSLLSSPLSASPSPVNLRKSRQRPASVNEPRLQDSPSPLSRFKQASDDDLSDQDSAGSDDVASTQEFELGSSKTGSAAESVDLSGRKITPDASLSAIAVLDDIEQQSPAEDNYDLEGGAIAHAASVEVAAEKENECQFVDKEHPDDRNAIDRGVDRHLPATETSTEQPDQIAAHDGPSTQGDKSNLVRTQSSAIDVNDEPSYVPSPPETEMPQYDEKEDNRTKGLADEDSTEAISEAEVQGESSLLRPGAVDRQGAEATRSGMKGELNDAIVEVPKPVSEGSPPIEPHDALNSAIHHDTATEDMVEDTEPQMLSPRSDPQSSDNVSVSSRADSFHSLASFDSSPDLDEASEGVSDHTPLAERHDPILVPGRHHRRDVSEMTVTVDNHAGSEMDLPVSPLPPSTATSEGPSTPALLRSSASDSSWPEVETPAAVSRGDGLRKRPKAKRSFSPLPPSSALLGTSPQSPPGNHLTGAIMQKARNLALGKPIEVVVMLVHILARIASGATINDIINGDLFRKPDDRGPGHRRNQSLPNQAGSPRSVVSEEDDYGVPIRGRSRSAAPSARKDDDADSLFDLD